MRKLCTFLLLGFFFPLYSSEIPRRLAIFFDWGIEVASRELEKAEYDPNNRQKEPVLTYFLIALAQKAAPIIVTSSLWHSFVTRRKIFEDFLEGDGLSYKKYTRFKEEATIKQFQTYTRAYFQPNGEQILGWAGQPIRMELDKYFFCYAIPFQENDWILKKASDYIYVLIPNAYLEQLKKSKELEKSEEQKKVFEEVKKTFKEQNKDKQIKELSDDDFYLGLKISKMEIMSYQDALDPDKHKLSIDRSKITELLNPKDVKMATLLPSLPENFILGKHFINIINDIFVTMQDLVVNKNAEKTELNQALYLHKWHIYQVGHGSSSSPGALQEINLAGVKVPTEWALQAGIELFTFREWLSFLQTSIKTEFLYYETCYSGGDHLKKLYEHQWDYPKTIVQKPDIFRYMIVTGNQLYTTTESKANMSDRNLSIPYKKALRDEIKMRYPIEFPSFFEAVKKYFSLDHIDLSDKKPYFDILKQITALQTDLQTRAMTTLNDWKMISDLRKSLEKLNFITLYAVISYVHEITKDNQPAVRYPGTEWFVPVPLDEKEQLAARLRFETSPERIAREAEEKRIKDLITEQAKKHIEEQKKSRKPIDPAEPTIPTTSVSSNSKNIIKAIRNLQQSLLQLKQSIF